MTEDEFIRNDDRAEAQRLAAALREPAGWPRPSAGFSVRCLAAFLIARHGGLRGAETANQDALRRAETTNQDAELADRHGVKRRWAKIAASIAAMASLAGFAMYCGAKYGLLGGDASDGGGHVSDVQAASAGEFDVLTQKGGNTVIARKMAGVVGAAVVSVAVSAAELTSEPTLVFMRPETSSFWNTATNSTMTVPVDFPSGATEAALTVSGLGYKATYANITKGTDSFTFALPAADSPQTENVYDLALTFNDGTVRRAKLGLIEGLSPNAEGTTRCLAPANGRVWNRVKGGKAVLPIPYGTTSFSVTVNGETRTEDTGLNGAQGWYALGLHGGDSATLSMIADGLSYSASLLGSRDGIVVVFQ